jgi:hypothetical protein
MFEYYRGTGETLMLAAVAAGVGHPAVAGLLGLGAAGLASAVVAMAWSVNVRQIRLAEQLARRQFIVTDEAGAAGRAVNGNGRPEAATEAVEGAVGAGPASPVLIDGPDTVVTGEQARYRVRPSGSRKVVSWAAGGGSVAQSPDPAHPDELLLIADQPGNLTVTVRMREGMMESRGMKSVTAVPDVTAAPPFTLRLFLHGWGLVVVAVLIVGFAGALDALGNLTWSPSRGERVTQAAAPAMAKAQPGPGPEHGPPQDAISSHSRSHIAQSLTCLRPGNGSGPRDNT